MKLPPEWLSSFLEQALARAPGPPSSSPAARRRAVLAHLSRSGLLFGAPLPEDDGHRLSEEMGLLRPLLRYLNRLTQAAVLATAADDRAALQQRLLQALAAVYAPGPIREAVAQGPSVRGYGRALARLTADLRGHRYLAGNPLVGLTLHHAFMATDVACLLDLLALHDVEGTVDELAIAARLESRLAEQEALVCGIGHLTLLRDDVDPEGVKDTVAWHMKHLGLSRRRAQRFTELARTGGQPAQVAALAPVEARGRVLLAVMMVARVDGRVSHEEREWLLELGELVDVKGPRWARVLRRVDRFCSDNRAALDPLIYAMAFELEGSPVPAKLVRALRDNAQGVWTEIRETGDLAVLLAKRSSGQQLTSEEAKRMREQLLDVARVIPGLAVFGLPGGAILLPVLTRLLPFDLRPSAFRPGAFRAFDEADGSLQQGDTATKAPADAANDAEAASAPDAKGGPDHERSPTR